MQKHPEQKKVRGERTENLAMLREESIYDKLLMLVEGKCAKIKEKKAV